MFKFYSFDHKNKDILSQHFSAMASKLVEMKYILLSTMQRYRHCIID